MFLLFQKKLSSLILYKIEFAFYTTLLHTITHYYTLLHYTLNMVKNTQGGSKHKSFARKNIHDDQQIRLSQHHDECYAKVNKMLGNGMCLVDIILDNTIHHDIVCHIRGKFRNKNKNNNLVSIHSILLVGIRQWTNQLNACDLLFVYSHHHINSLPISLFHNNHLHYDNDVSFSHDNTTHNTLTTLDNNHHNQQLLLQQNIDQDIDFFHI